MSQSQHSESSQHETVIPSEKGSQTGARCEGCTKLDDDATKIALDPSKEYAITDWRLMQRGPDQVELEGHVLGYGRMASGLLRDIDFEKAECVNLLGVRFRLGDIEKDYAGYLRSASVPWFEGLTECAARWRHESNLKDSAFLASLCSEKQPQQENPEHPELEADSQEL